MASTITFSQADVLDKFTCSSGTLCLLYNDTLRGIIVQENSENVGTVVSPTFGFNRDINLEDANEFKDLTLSIGREGTLIRVFKWEGQVFISTHRKIFAKNSHYGSVENFEDAFLKHYFGCSAEDTPSSSDISHLDTNFTHFFILTTNQISNVLRCEQRERLFYVDSLSPSLELKHFDFGESLVDKEQGSPTPEAFFIARKSIVDKTGTKRYVESLKISNFQYRKLSKLRQGMNNNYFYFMKMMSRCYDLNISDLFFFDESNSFQKIMNKEEPDEVSKDKITNVCANLFLNFLYSVPYKYLEECRNYPAIFEQDVANLEQFLKFLATQPPNENTKTCNKFLHFNRGIVPKIFNPFFIFHPASQMKFYTLFSMIKEMNKFNESRPRAISLSI
jgi:hypothetical protein